MQLCFHQSLRSRPGSEKGTLLSPDPKERVQEGYDRSPPGRGALKRGLMDMSHGAGRPDSSPLPKSACMSLTSAVPSTCLSSPPPLPAPQILSCLKIQGKICILCEASPGFLLPSLTLIRYCLELQAFMRHLISPAL